MKSWNDLTDEQLQAAIQNATAAGDQEAANAFSDVLQSRQSGGRTIRKQYEFKDSEKENGGAVAFLNKGLSTFAGGGVDLINAGLGMVGVPVSDAPFGGSKSIRKGLKKVGITAPERAPESVWEHIGQVAGEAAGFAAPMGAAARLSAPARGMLNAPQGVGRGMLQAANKEMVSSPGRMAIMEAGGVGGAGVARAASENNDLGPGASMLAEVAGGIGGAGLARGAQLAALNSPSVLTAKGLMRTFAPFTPEGAKLRAAGSYQKQLQDPGMTADEIASLEGLNMLPAAKGNDPALIGIQQAAMSENENFSVRVAKRTSEAYKSLTDAFRLEGNSRNPRRFVRNRVNRLEKLMESRIEAAAEKAKMELSRLDPNADAPTISATVRKSIQGALDEATLTENSLWKAVPEDALVSLEGVRNKVLDTLASLPKFQQNDFPDIARNLLKNGIEVEDGKAFLSEMDGAYKTLGQIAANARAGTMSQGQNRNMARIAEEIRESILEAMGNAKVPAGKENALRLAREFSAKKAERFSQGPIGHILGTGKVGGDIVDETLTLEKLLVGGQQGRLGAEAVERAVGGDVGTMEAVQDFIKAKFVRDSVNPETGKILPSAAESFARKNKELLDAFPALRDQIRAARHADDMTRRLTDRRDAFRRKMERPEVSAAARILKAPIDQEIDSIMSSANPGETMGRLMGGKMKADTEAAAGMKAGFADWLLRSNSAPGVEDVFGIAAVNGTKMRAMLKVPRVREAMEHVFSADEIKVLERNAEMLARLNLSEKKMGGAAKLLDDKVNYIARAAARVLGAYGSSLAPSPNAGVGLQKAQIASSASQRATQHLALHRAQQIAIDALLDDELMVELLRMDIPRRVKRRHERILNAYAASRGLRLFEGEEQEQEQPDQ